MTSLVGELDGQQSVPAMVAQRLLASVAEIGDSHASLAERRLSLLTALGEAVDADVGVWAWGRGWPDSSTLVPVAHISFGVNEQQRVVLMEWGFDAEQDRSFRPRILAQMGSRRAATSLWRDLYTPAEWDAVPLMRRQLIKGGWSSWLNSVRYSDRDTWSSFFLLRRQGKPEFDSSDAMVVHWLLGGVPWLQSTAEETLPPEAFVGLTPRQRTVMLMLLDGQARKTIARRLDITELTVGDHIKSIYAHFGVNSSGELAAHFLRGR